MKKFIIIYLFIISACLSDQNPGAVFLMINPGARPTSLGGAFTAIADDVNALYYNPAGLGFFNGTDAIFTHAQWLPGLVYPGMLYQNLGVTHYFKDIGGFGLSLIFLNSGEMDVINEYGQYIGSYSTYDIAYTLSFGKILIPSFGIGVSLKYIYSYLVPEWVWKAMPELGIEAGGTAKALGFDFGMLFKAEDFLSFGASIQNLGTRINYFPNTAGDPLPYLLRIGFKVSPIRNDFFRLTITPEITEVLTIREKPWNSLGIEMNIKNTFLLRLGYFEDVDGWRGGILIRDTNGYERVISLFDLLSGEAKGKEVRIRGIYWGAGIKFGNFVLDIGIDEGIYDFPTINRRASLSFRFP